MFKYIRPWMFSALAAVASYVVQLSPMPGVILMMMGAVLWPGAFINLTVLLLAIDCFIGKMPKLFLIGPVVYLSVGLGVCLLSWADVRTLEAQLSAMDQPAHIAYDPARQIIIADRDSDLYSIPRTLQASYKLDLMYLEPSDNRRGYEARYFLPEAQCPERHNAMRSDIHREGASINHTFINNACFALVPQRPDRLPIMITRSHTTVPAGAEKAEVEQFTVQSGQQHAVLNTARTYVYPPIPMLFAGCALSDASSSWECGAFWLKVPHQVRSNSDVISGLAQMLGLQPRTVTPAGHGLNVDFAPDPHTPNVREQGVRMHEERLDAFYQELPAMIRDPHSMRTAEPWQIIVTSPERNAQHVDLLLNGLANSLDDPHFWDVRRVLALGIMVLPDDAWQAQRPRIMHIVANRHAYDGEPGLLTRLGDYGLEALPLLMRELDAEEGGVATGAALGMCRIGAPANTPQVRAALLAHPNHRGGVSDATFMALLRIGAHADAEHVQLQPYEARWRAEQLAAINPQSPRSVCQVDRHNTNDRMPA